MTSYELQISDWSSDVCSSDLRYAYVCCLFFCEVVFLENFPCQVQVIDGSLAVRIVHNDGNAEARCFAQPCIALDDGIEDKVVEMGTHFFDHLIGKPQPHVIHRQQDAFDL